MQPKAIEAHDDSDSLTFFSRYVVKGTVHDMVSDDLIKRASLHSPTILNKSSVKNGTLLY